MSGKKILVADDQPNVTLLICEWLEANGYIVKTAFDGQEALRAAVSFQPDAAILDVMMPKEDGCSVSRRIKTLFVDGRGGKATKVLLMTGKHPEDDPDFEEMVNSYAMADAVLYKPFALTNLINTVRLLLTP